MGNRYEPVPAGDLFFQFADRAVFEFHNAGAFSAYQVMMMAVITLQQQLEPGNPIPKFKSFHHAHILQQMHAPIYRRQVAAMAGERGKNLLRR
jgi:hypothetical protein